jgi:hypothetical protein
MMEEYFIGVYWTNRKSTLREYATNLIGLLRLLRSAHPDAFAELSWVGDRAGASVKLNSDLSNVEELVHRHAGFDDSTYDITRPDGGPAWEAISSDGFSMHYNTGRSSKAGGISLSITDGQLNKHIPDSCVLRFPGANSPGFAFKEFGDSAFLKSLLLAMIEYWRPDFGLVTSHLFSRMVVREGSPAAGWHTYVKDPRAQALRNDAAFRSLRIENGPFGGTLFSLNTEYLSPSDAGQIIQVRRLHEKLTSERLVDL